MAKDVLLQRLPDRGVWDLVKGADGDVASTDSEQHAVLTQLLDYAASPGRAGWVWDEDGTHGSLLYLITEDTPAQRSNFKAYALAALKPLVDENRIRDVSVEVQASVVVPGRIDGVINYSTATGQQQPIVTPLSFP